GLRQSAQAAQQALKLLGIDRHETGLIRHFMALKKAKSATPLRRSTSAPQIKRSKSVVHAEDKNSSLMPILLVSAIVLALVAIPFLKRLKPPGNDEVASSKTPSAKKTIEFTKLGEDRNPNPREKRPSIQTAVLEENKDPREERPTNVSDLEPDVKTIGELNKTAARKSRGVKLLEAESFVRQALAAHKEENSEGAMVLAGKARQVYQSLSLDKRTRQCERLGADLKNYQKLQSTLFPEAITGKKGEALSLEQFKGMKIRVVEAIPGGARAKLSVGGSTDLIWKTMFRADVYTVLSSASLPRPYRMSLATLALLEGEEVAHGLFRTLWNELPGHREEISSRLALVLRPGSDGFRIQKGRFVPDGQGTNAGAPLLVAGKIHEKDSPVSESPSTPKFDKVDPAVPYRAMLVAIKDGKAGLGSQWKSFKKAHWGQLEEAQQSSIKAALKRGHGRNLKELDKVIQKASRVKVAGNAKQKLKELRDYALAGIYDKVLYPDANHGRAGQPEIDKRVEALTTLWERGMAKLRGIPKARKLKASLARSKSLMIDAGFNVDDPLFLTSFKSITENYRYCTGISALDGQLRRRDGLHYDMQVLAFNKALKGIPGDCRQQVRILNEYRMMQGRHCLAINLNLSSAAKKHCAWMQESGTFSHTSSLSGLKTPRQRAKASGYKSPFVGENIAKGQPSAGTVHKAWYNSAPHHRNMLEKVYYEIGVGHVGQHWTQLFGGGRPTLR
ncbi:MAG: CAP domain-containing protein, partial [Planctomycetota bacterium]|nr:CAP domain-containing protein [Planctomycetota bacterium]